MSDKESESKHGSYGAVQIHRVTSGKPRRLFDSPLGHTNFITLKVCRAYHIRALNENRIMADEELVEVEMSEVQFAQMITSLNLGMGTPCTITRVGGDKMPQCPATDEKRTFEDEIKGKLEEVVNTLASLDELVDEVAGKPRLSAADKERLKDAAARARREVQCNLPFIQKQFAETMEKAVAQGRAEIEAHIANAIRKSGAEAIAGLAAEMPRLDGPTASG